MYQILLSAKAELFCGRHQPANSCPLDATWPPALPQEFNISINCKHLYSFLPSRRLYQQLVHYPQVKRLACLCRKILSYRPAMPARAVCFKAMNGPRDSVDSWRRRCLCWRVRGCRVHRNRSRAATCFLPSRLLSPGILLLLLHDHYYSSSSSKIIRSGKSQALARPVKIRQASRKCSGGPFCPSFIASCLTHPFSARGPSGRMPAGDRTHHGPCR